MDQKVALLAFGALSQETRLQALRKLVAAGPEGLSAGQLAEAVAVSPSNISFHLKELDHAGLVEATRVSRSILYRANFEALSELVRFLMEDCCSGRPEICAPLGFTLCVPAENARSCND